MLTLNVEQNAVVLRGKSGVTLWRGELAVEDEADQHICFWDENGAGQAGQWRLKLVPSSLDGDLFCLSVSILPISGRKLERVFLRLEGGRDAVPPLDSSDTKMLGMRGGTFGEDGVVSLGKDSPAKSSLVTVLSHPDQKYSLLFGLGNISEDFSYFQAEGKSLAAGFHIDRVIQKQETYCLALGAGPGPLDLLNAYGSYLSRFARPVGAPQTGWNSWDYYGAAVSMKSVREEMAAINASPLKGKLKYVVLDMGWEQAWGEWIPNRRFPAKYRTIAKEVEGAGFVPGIWVAPLQAHTFSLLGRHRQDLLIQNPNGGPVIVDQNALLDFTLSDVHDILRGWFCSMREAGFQLFKLDYIYESYLDVMNCYADQTRGKAGVIRKGLEVIRQAVGDDSHIINCGAPVESALGLADSSRVTIDIHTFWGHVKHNASQLASRLWQNGNLWHVDPDFAVIRSARTTNDPFPNYIYNRQPLVEGKSYWMAGPEASHPELLVWLTQVYLSAGNVFLSDSVARLNKKGINTLVKLLPPLEQSARPLDMFMNPIPRFWYAQSANLLGVFNWEDQEAPIVMPTGIDLPSQGVDIWSGERHKISELIIMPPRSAWLLKT